MVSILQLVILIIPGDAFRVLIPFAWCPRQGWWGRGSEGAEFLQCQVVLQSLARRPLQKAGRSPPPFKPRLETPAPRPQVYLVKEHLAAKGILVVNDHLKDPHEKELVRGGRECV